MPELLLGSGSNFDRWKSVLSNWLKSNFLHVSVLTKNCLKEYGSRKFIAGWGINITHKESEIAFHVLIDAQFPYSAIKLAYKSSDVYFKWPHVDEENGILCLPKHAAPILNVEEVIRSLILDALELHDRCKNPQFLISEFKNEFRTYWERRTNCDGGSVPVRSLLDLENRRSRAIFLWREEKFTLAGENSEHIVSWLKNSGRKNYSKIERGIFCFLSEAPTPPFPDSPAQLFSLLKNNASKIDTILSAFSQKKVTTFVIAANSPSGDGMVSAELSIPNTSRPKGFRKKSPLSLPEKKQLWKFHSELSRTNVERVDSAWVHGRGLDVQHNLLYRANVLVLGCGSLGSQVALRLAQAGVGSLTLIDPQVLVAANVGRHALGIDSVGWPKAVKLAELIKARFPHVRRAKGYPGTWQQYLTEEEVFNDHTTLIVSCLGEWAADGQLGEWYFRSKPGCPIVYGWLDEYGTASHGVVLDSSGPHLGCILGDDGALRLPETIWSSSRENHVEPACGTFFQPYGPLDVAKAEILVTRLCIDVVTSSAQIPCHRVHACSSSELRAVGGQWSAEHLKYRPDKFEGSFEYGRPVANCGICFACRVSNDAI